MLPHSQVFEVVATPKIGGGELVLRRFRNHGAAAKHALAVDMTQWDDVLVRQTLIPAQVSRKKAKPVGPPPMPWRVVWLNGGYIVDADGDHLAALMGGQEQREFVAQFLTEATAIPEPEAIS